MNDPGPVTGNSPHAYWLNKLRRHVLSLHPKTAPGWRIDRGPNGWYPMFPPGVGGGISLAAYKFESMGSGYIKCRPWDGQQINPDGDPIAIALPHEISGVILQEKIDSVVWTYTNDILNQKRTATSTSGTENQVITPRYLPWTEETGNIKATIIMAVAGPVFVTDQAGKGIDLLDLNIAGRAWAAY